MVLAVGSPGPLPPGTGNLVTIAASVVSLVAGHVSTARLGALAEAVTRAATGSDQASLEGTVAQALRRDTGEQWRVLACAPGRGLTRAEDLQRWREHVAVSVRTVLRLDDGDSVVALIPERAAPEKVAKDLASGSDVVGLSDPCRWPALPAATRQARRRLAAARVEAPAGPRLRDLIDREAAEGFVEAVLGPVLAARRTRPPGCLPRSARGSRTAGTGTGPLPRSGSTATPSGTGSPRSRRWSAGTCRSRGCASTCGSRSSGTTRRILTHSRTSDAGAPAEPARGAGQDSAGGRYWVRTSDLFGVNEARYHCANRPVTCAGKASASERRPHIPGARARSR